MNEERPIDAPPQGLLGVAAALFVSYVAALAFTPEVFAARILGVPSGVVAAVVLIVSNLAIVVLFMRAAR